MVYRKHHLVVEKKANMTLQNRTLGGRYRITHGDSNFSLLYVISELNAYNIR
ncbi:unnamed protein product [Acanthoscelides obtectus]|uniref:Uncharacterized protein n=1 Tax=Acanthoscelides obtectus TaxID=200917 RepID=A0A9P0K6L4_ACAOB|nr:unnamed protein product [Acanthoscelides obtectus]CAK1639424.1 hypothetical protein AOBTE_LOCUS11176 [Acanthoscelides obtectus]